MSGTFTPYITGLSIIRDRLGSSPGELSLLLEYEHRLLANIQQAQTSGDSSLLQTERIQLINELNVVAIQAGGQNFNQFCELPPDQKLLTTRRKLIPPLTIFFYNALIASILILLLYAPMSGLAALVPWLACITPLISLSGAALSLLAAFHLIWRSHSLKIAAIGGSLGVGEVNLPIKLLVYAGDGLHPWNLPDAILQGACIILLFAGLICLSPLSPSPPPKEVTPVIQNFSIQYLGSEQNTTLQPGQEFGLTPNQQVWVQANTLTHIEPVCTWSAANGRLQPAQGCATFYNAPINQVFDILSLTAVSYCKTQTAGASLHISIKSP